MRWIIDGHNLVPFIPGLSLADLDDENRLIEWVQQFLKGNHDSIELYFDKAAIGQPKTRSLGRLKIIHVDRKIIADQAIIQRLNQLGNAAEQVTVVSSDHSIQTNARAARAKVMDSPAFFTYAIRQSARKTTKTNPDPALSTQEVDEWLNLFSSRPDSKP
jgi:uncharacterized protein